MPLQRYVAFARASVSLELRPHYEQFEYVLDGYLEIEEDTIFQADWRATSRR